MKKVLLASAFISVMSLSGCTTMSEIFGRDMTGTHDVHSKINNKAPVTSLNGVLVDANKHMTLYTYDKDTLNNSNCDALCLAAWPAFLAPNATKSSDGRYTTIQRADGKYQWTLNGRPLYFYANDTQPGDKKGDEKMGVWHTVATR